MINTWIVLIHGASATGKSSLARYIEDAHHVPIVQRDAIKERLFEQLYPNGADDWTREKSQHLGLAATHLMWDRVELLLRSGVRVILAEDVFVRKTAHQALDRLAKIAPFQLLEIYLHAERGVRQARFTQRALQSGQRHPVHADAQIAAPHRSLTSEQAQSHESSRPPIDYPGSTRYNVDTTDFEHVDFDAALAEIHRLTQT